MNSELEKLIDLALVDGKLTDKEKEILTRKAIEFGTDMDEFEMVLEGKLFLAQQLIYSNNSSAQNVLNSNKESSSNKCPSCGAPIQSFSSNCSHCGFEFRNIESNNTINKLFELLNETENNNRSNTLYGKMQSSFLNVLLGASDVDKKKMEIISSFPIPNTKEDLLEFLALGVPKAKLKYKFGLIEGAEDKIPNMFARIWKEKCIQIVIKARFAMKEDKSTLQEIEYYAKQLGIK